MTSLNAKQAYAESLNQVAESVPASPELRVVPLADPQRMASLSSRELRSCFLLDDLFQPGFLQLVYSDHDRAVVGSAVPLSDTLLLDGRSSVGYSAERRELGVINLGGPGLVEVDGAGFELKNRDGLYIGRGNPGIRFSSREPETPAVFYMVSYPAHASYPVRQVRKEEAEHVQLGDPACANHRNLYKYIHPGGVQSCQLVMGLTELCPGSVWNTMPVHLHERRSEVYLYFDLPENGIVVHCLGQPTETRHIMVRNRQAVLSPSWSIHAGAGTSHYSFVWAMGGENQEFSDMKPIPMEELA